MATPLGKLTPSEIKFWVEEAKSCENRQRKELIERNNYPFLVGYYEGIEKINPAYPHITPHESLAIINEFFPNTNALISEIMYQNPDIIAEATKPEAEDNENLMRAALMYAFDKTDALIENRVALFDMLYAGYSCVEVDHLTQKAPSIYLPSETEFNERQTIGQKIKGVFKPASVKEAEEKLEKSIPEDEEAYATNEKTYIKRWSPLSVPLDWRASRIRDRRYNLKIIEMSKAEFDAKYPKFKDKIAVTEEKFDFSQHEHQRHSKMVKLYEFQIKMKDYEYWNLVISPNYHQSEIDYYKRPYITNNFNMKIGTLHKYGKLYPISFAQVNKKMQDELNHYIKFIMSVAERNIPKRLYDINKVKQGAIDSLTNTKVNDMAGIDGPTINAVTQLPHTNVSIENKELIQIFRDQKEKLWSVSESRMTGKSDAKFATEIAIQEAGFQAKQVDVQEGLRFLIKEELGTAKDIIVNFWDGEYFFKVTGGQKPEWYTPIKDPLTGMILNPLTDILIGDYNIKVDISSALRPNREKKKNDLVLLLRELTSPNLQQVLLMQQQMLNMDFIHKIIKEFGLNPENVFIEAPPMLPQEGQNER